MGRSHLPFCTLQELPPVGFSQPVPVTPGPAQSNVHDVHSPVHEAGSCFVGVKEDIVSRVEY